MKLLILPKWFPYPSDELDGVFVVDQINSLPKEWSVAVVFVHACDSIEVRKKLDISTKQNHIEYSLYFKPYFISVPFLRSFISACLYFYYQVKLVQKVKSEWGKPNAIWVQVLARTIPMAIVLSKKWKVPVYLSEHSSRINRELSRRSIFIKKLYYRYIGRQCKRISAVSKNLADDLEKLVGQPVQVISNTVDPDLFTLKTGEKVLSNNFVHISTYSESNKQFDKILLVMAELKKMKLSFRLDVFGCNNGDESLILLAKDLGLLNTFVFFHGVKEKKEIVPFLHSAKATILFSKRETQSCVLLESLTVGTPVISSRCGGPEEFIQSVNGILVDSENELIEA